MNKLYYGNLYEVYNLQFKGVVINWVQVCFNDRCYFCFNIHKVVLWFQINFNILFIKSSVINYD